MIYNPVKGYRNQEFPVGDVTQWFGENPDLYMSAVGLKSHNGIDIVRPWGEPIYAVEGGLVCEVKTDPSGYGKHVRILSTKYEWTYGHLSAICVKLKQPIKAGEQIGNMGNTGFVVSSSDGGGFWPTGSNKYLGTHLHLGCREIIYDHTGWTYGVGIPKINIVNYDNGWKGSINFREMFYNNPAYGDMEILRNQLDLKEPWWMILIKAAKFFGFN